MDILSYTNITNFGNIAKKDYTGHELVSLLLPQKLNLSRGGLEIKNGKLIKGQLKKDFVGAKKKNTIQQLILEEYDENEAQDFLDNMVKVCDSYIMYYGYSAGNEDLEVDKKVKEQNLKLFQTKELQIEHLITEIENNPELKSKDTVDKIIYAELNGIREDVANILMDNMNPNNGIGIMISAGSKGDKSCYAQMCGCIGFQSYKNGSMPEGENNRRLCYFHANDDRASARGMITNSYYDGMDFTEFFYHNGSGRYGLISVSVLTAESGYAQRRMIKMLEDAIVRYDGTIRLSSGKLLQLIPNDTGADTSKQYLHVFKMIPLNNDEIKEVYGIKEEDFKKYNLTKKDNEEYCKKVMNLRDVLRITQMKSKVVFDTISSEYMLPVNIVRIIRNAVNNEELKKLNEQIDYKYVIDVIDYILDNKNTMLICTNKKDNKIKINDEKICKTSFEACLHDILSPSRCFYEHKLNKAQINYIRDEVINSFNKSMVEPGESLGI